MPVTNREYGKKLLELYGGQDFETLAKSNLMEPVDESGNTIVHVMAMKLDENALEKMRKMNPRSLAAAINQANAESDRPIHKAMETLQNSDNHDFITYMINKLGADHTIPNKNKLIITRVDLKNTDLKNDSNLNRFSPEVINNISKIMAASNSNSRGNMHQLLEQNSCAKFVKSLLDHYKQESQKSQKQKGGYCGKRTIGGYSDFSESFSESGPNDSFIVRRHNKSLGDYDYLTNQGRPQRFMRDPKVTEAYKEIIRKIMTLLDVDEETAKLYGQAIKYEIGQRNPELRKRENDALRIREIEKLLEDDDKAKKFIKDLGDIEDIRRNILQAREENEARRREWLKTHPRRDRGPDSVTSDELPREPKDSEDDSGKKTRKPRATKASKNSETSDEPAKKEPKKRARKVVDGGYIVTDEMIFSDE